MFGHCLRAGPSVFGPESQQAADDDIELPSLFEALDVTVSGVSVGRYNVAVEDRRR